MTPHDYLIILIQVLGWLAVMWRNNRKDAIRTWQHEKMWNEYAGDHGINGHAKTLGRAKGDWR